MASVPPPSDHPTSSGGSRMATTTTTTTGTKELNRNEALVIVSMMLQDFYENNSNDVVLTSGKILMTLLQNATITKQTTTTADDPTKLEKYRKIRLTNPKIKEHIVQVDTALDILGLAGFEQQGNGEFLIYNNNPQSSQGQQRNALELYLEEEEEGNGVGGNDNNDNGNNEIIDAICSGLQVKIKEIELIIKKNTATATTTNNNKSNNAASSSTGNNNNNNNNKSKATTNNNNNASASSSSSSPFLSQEERLKRVAKIKAMKKEKKAQREAAVERWKENMDEKKEASKRREAMLSAKVEANAREENGGLLLAANITVKSATTASTGGGTGGVLPKPFEDPKEQLAAAARARAERNSNKNNNSRIINSNNNNGTNSDGGSKEDPQAIRRNLIQETMKDPKLNPKEKQTKVQQIMKMGNEELLQLFVVDAAAAAANEANDHQDGMMDLEASSTTTATANNNKKDDGTVDEIMEEADDEENQKPAASVEKVLPDNNNNNHDDDLITSRTPSPPSKEWKKFIDNVPRCAGAEGIRDSSVFFRQRRGGGGGGQTTTIPQCLKRLFKELDGLKDALPSDPNCSIWLRFDEETPQYIRALVTAPLPGPTPYSGGLFAFDIYVPNDYPRSNPKVQIITTGGGTVRFGPNLYADGKVCLSLLGTWSGPKWNPKHSSLYQVLISIQGLILGVEHPYYLEPGHGGWEGNVKEGDFQVKGQSLSGKTLQQEVGVPMEVILYEDELRVGSVKYAMAQPLRWALEGSANTTGLEAFNDIIQAHFFENKSGILAEVRIWGSDQALGRKRDDKLETFAGRGAYKLGTKKEEEEGAASKNKLRIDELQDLLPKLEALLDKTSMPSTASATLKSPPPPPPPAAAVDDNAMDTEEEDNGKPPASPSTKRDKEQEDTNTKRNKTETPSPPPPAPAAAAPTSDVDVVEQKRQQMQEAAGKGDYVLAGRLQEEVKRLEELQRGMQEAAQQNDFIRAGRLQAQFKALTATDTTKPTTSSSNTNTATAAASSSAWNDEDEEMDDDDNDDFDSDMEEDMGMGGGGPPFAFGGMPHGLGKNVFAPPGYNSHLTAKNHAWGSGNQLGNTAAPSAAPGGATAVEEPTKKAAAAAAPKKSIPPDQLCRLRIRLPQNNSIVEDFDRNESLSAVYRRVELHMPEEDRKKSPVMGPAAAVGGGAFAQPLSSAGFTLLLTRPKREFSLEMHGTKSLLDLNLAPSATLTVMRCSDRGITKRGEVESRLEGAQGDAIDVEGLSYEALTELTERVGKAGPKEGSSFLTLTAEQFEANTKKFSPSSYLTDLDDTMEEVAEDQLRCPICLGNYDRSDTSPSLRKLKTCQHIMHCACLQTWLRTNSSCPLCKSSVV